jgi:hypothetical protein
MSDPVEQNKSYQRNRNDYDNRDGRDNRDKKKDIKDDDVRKEVSNLIKEGYSEKNKIPAAKLMALKLKYGDDEVLQKIHDELRRSSKRIHRKIEKFTDYMLKKYNANYPLHEILKKALKYKKDLSDYEFNEFFKIVQKRLANSELPVEGDELNILRRRTRMNKLLGTVERDIIQTKINVDTKDLGVLAEIMNSYAKNKLIHSQAMLQSLSYSDCAEEAMVGKFDRTKHNPATHIHPILVAMFVPKINYFERNIVYASIANILKSRKEGEDFLTESDRELHWNIVTDPNDVVCDAENPLVDLKHRSELQAKIWENIVRLRNGQYYDAVSTDFLMAIENCKMNVYDAPDLMYSRDEGMILRKILSCFSLRPTVVTTTPIYGASIQSYGLYNPFNNTVPHVTTTIPMITLRLPRINENFDAQQDNQQLLTLQSALNQPQWFVENKTLAIKSQQVILSNEVLIFHVPRRYQKVGLPKFTGPYTFNKLPLTIGGSILVNTTKIEVPEEIPLESNVYKLKSVVFVEIARDAINANRWLAVGTSTGIVLPVDPNKGRFAPAYVLYDPVGSYNLIHIEGHTVSNGPMTFINATEPIIGNDASGYEAESFWSKAQTKGSVFIYVNENAKNDVHATWF